jgi:hypothetical protein
MVVVASGARPRNFVFSTDFAVGHHPPLDAHRSEPRPVRWVGLFAFRIGKSGADSRAEYA